MYSAIAMFDQPRLSFLQRRGRNSEQAAENGFQALFKLQGHRVGSGQCVEGCWSWIIGRGEGQGL